jgi:putative resolvase
MQRTISAQDRLRIAEAAKYLGVHPDTLRRWERAGKIRAYRTPGGERRFDIVDLDQAIKAAS